MVLTPVIVGVSYMSMPAHFSSASSSRPLPSAPIVNSAKVAAHYHTPAPITPSVPPTPQSTPVPASLVKKSFITTHRTPIAVPIVTPAPNSSVSGLTPLPSVSSPIPSTTPALTTTPSPTSIPNANTTTSGYTSSNWAGYMATSSTYTAVSGSWIVPHATSNSSETTADVTWVGIGGVSTDDLIQVGTQNMIEASGRVTTTAFYELLPGYSQTIPNVSVSAGDAISASLTEVTNGQWLIYLIDTTTNQSFSQTLAYASTRSSAEWIEEDPSYANKHQIPFDSFGSTTFTNGTTAVSGTSDTIASSNAQSITMLNSAGQAIATPSQLGLKGTTFSVQQGTLN